MGLIRKNIKSIIIVIITGIALYFFFMDKSIPVALVTRLASGSIIGSSEVNSGDLFKEEHPDTIINVLPLDDQFEPEKAVTVVEQAIKSGVHFFITSQPSKCDVSIMSMFEQPRALAIVLSSTTPALTGKDDFIFRIISDAEHEQRSIARYINSIDGNRILVLQDESNLPYTDPAFKYFSYELGRLNKWHIDHRKLIVSEFNPDELKTVMNNKYDMLYILAGSHQPAIGNIAQLFNQIAPDKPIMLTPWSRSPVIFQIAGPAINRLILPSHYPTSKALDDYLQRFYKRFGYKPSSLSYMFCQAIELFDRAFSLGYTTPKQVKKYFLSIPTHETSLGQISFDQYGDVTQTYNFIVDLRSELQ